jgi:DNA polymerase-4
MEKALKSIGVSTVGQLRAVPLETLQERFGKWAEDIYDLARGLGSRTVQPDSEAKSIGAETTFEEDTNDKDFLERMLLELSEDVGWRLREAGLHARNITLKVRFSDFRTITRSSTLPGTTNATIEIYGSALDLLRTKVNLTQERIRLIGVTAASLSAGGPGQLLLFGEPKQKVKKVDAVVDAVRRKLGRDAVKRGRLME